jgi:hypothetical protein
MGTIQAAPLVSLALALVKAGRLENFIETGTYLGTTMPWASTTFRKVWTIEINPDYQRQAKINAGNVANVSFLLGNSRDRIAEVCGALDGPALFWLDAHAGAGYFGPDENCPLLEELQAVFGSPHPHCILVDDARAFLAAPPPPFDYRKWPSLDQIMAVVLARSGYHVTAIADVLIIVPADLRDVVAQWCTQIRPTI